MRAHFAGFDTVRPFALGFCGLAWLLVGAACGGENLFQDPSGISNDRRGPTAMIIAPEAEHRVAVGDSVLVSVRLTDDRGIADVELSGFALRGSAVLGTQARVPRFEPKVVDLETARPQVRDTVVSRYLYATGDSLVEDTVFLVARVKDVAGNQAADSIRIRIGGSRVQIVTPLSGAEVRAGGDVRVRISAGDAANRIQSLRLSAAGAVTRETFLNLDPARTSIDTIIDLPVPGDLASGEIRLQASVRNTLNDSTASAPVFLTVISAVQDTRPPTVRFSVAAPARAEREDSVAVTVTAVDNTRLDRVGITLLPIHRRATGTDTLTIVSVTAPTDSMTFRVALSQLGVPVPTDTSTLRLEVTAFAVDTAGNCATATVPNTPLSEACTGTQPVRGIRPGARYEILVVRGHTIRLTAAGDRIADIAADGSNLFLSNITRNRLEVLPIGATSFSAPVAVGSKPWGLAFNRTRSLLYVANSGGTNISVVSPTAKQEVQRIQTPNVKLYDVAFTARTIANPDTLIQDSLSAYYPTSVVRFDYSDRPQYIGVTQNENLVFSTVPTAAAPDGTVRVYRTLQERLEIVTEYAEERVGDKVVIVNADSAFLVSASPDNLIQVCPRNRSTDPTLDRNLPVTCMVGPVNVVEETITQMGYDTRFLYSLNINEIGLADTTFVAVSGDHSTVAVGEGARTNGRVMSLTDPAGQVDAPLVRHGEVRDLVGNTAERLIGLALNRDGSLGVARGNEAYFFSRDLRLQGVVETDAGGGGVDMHVDNPGINRAFISGVAPDGLAFIDVMDTFHFRRMARIFLRDPVTGPVRAVRTPQGGLKVYAVTQGGIVEVDVLTGDL